jgi:hypothetical protein
MSELSALAKTQLLDHHLWVAEGASEVDKSKKKEYSLRKHLIAGIIECAHQHVLCCGEAHGAFEKLVSNGVEIVDALQRALLRTPTGTPSDWNFWQHERNPLHIIAAGRIPNTPSYIVEGCATRYLELPYRVPSLERVIVDVLIAVEMYSYGEEMVAPEPDYLSGLAPRSPLRERHELLSYLRGNLISGVVLLGAAFLVHNFAHHVIGQLTADWIAVCLAALFVLGLSLSTLFLPNHLRQQYKSRKIVRKLMTTLVRTYSELGSEGALSARRIREAVTMAASDGVVWPGPLYAILDDNIARCGRL